MKDKIIKILEKYDIDEYHWKLEIADEIDILQKNALQGRKKLIKDWCKYLYKNEEFVVDDKIINRYLKQLKT